jgi:hypothetical protein
VAASKNGTSSTDGESRCDQPTGYIVDSPFIQSAIDFGIVRRDEGVQRSKKTKRPADAGPENRDSRKKTNRKPWAVDASQQMPGCAFCQDRVHL